MSHTLFTKLDAQGNALPDTATDFAAVRVNNGAVRFDMLAGNVGDRRMNHEAATAACAAIDARVPTLEELEAIRDISRFGPAVDPTFFPDIKSAGYWSSSTDASDPDDYAWIVHFYDGYVNLYYRDRNAWVRAVRSVPASQ